nr:reverse transcriptase domain-containing protein [Tanacetum cinerariifolium]
MISKDDTISKFPGYQSSEEEKPTGQSRALNKYGFVDHPELQRNEFSLHRLPQRKGMSWADFKALLVEEFYPSNEMEKLESDF